MTAQEIFDLVTGQTFGIWFLIGAALVFWMQAGFCNGRGRFYQSKKYW